MDQDAADGWAYTSAACCLAGVRVGTDGADASRQRGGTGLVGCLVKRHVTRAGGHEMVSAFDRSAARSGPVYPGDDGQAIETNPSSAVTRVEDCLCNVAVWHGHTVGCLPADVRGAVCRTLPSLCC